MKNIFTRGVLVFAVVTIGGIREAKAGMWVGLSPGGYGFSWQTPVVLINGEDTLYAFTFEGILGSSSACDWVPSVVLDSPFSPDKLFCSLDPERSIIRKDWPVEHLSAGATRYFSYTVYISSPNLDTILPNKYYGIGDWWQPYLPDTGGGINVLGEIGGVIRMQIIPESATLLILGLGGILVRRKVG